LGWLACRQDEKGTENSVELPSEATMKLASFFIILAVENVVAER